MKIAFFSGMILSSLMYLSCGNASQNTTKKPDDANNQIASLYAKNPTTVDTNFIDMTIANEMIKSYTESIGGYDVGGSDLSSLILDANSLRTLLADTGIQQVKIMLAHTENYMSTGNFGQPAGYKKNALTIVAVGVDGTGNYVLQSGNQVLNRALPCPNQCPVGTASSYLISH